MLTITTMLLGRLCANQRGCKCVSGTWAPAFCLCRSIRGRQVKREPSASVAVGLMKGVCTNTCLLRFLIGHRHVVLRAPQGPCLQLDVACSEHVETMHIPARSETAERSDPRRSQSQSQSDENRARSLVSTNTCMNSVKYLLLSSSVHGFDQPNPPPRLTLTRPPPLQPLATSGIGSGFTEPESVLWLGSIS